ncbi:GNAT family N-acetyltransferase [Hyphomicrobium sp. CS1BSMeth3]|uniref:GNAT family N-acetyltransferase n=1 Tax=Hyphomicrobium sp. CS1BSMeth3 TaxID=1892844 RepID=UPI00086CDE90|nr:GNAT family N-acetyltransferase [Hyphomicrobium sp. CS1BSMeth3]ODT22182.1 MAG: GNAT family N-acetyltransferase [Hyphomicrobium sp. SCN 65-11]
MDAARYAAIETLRDGRAIEIRALRPGDRDGLLLALQESSAESRYRRFFSGKSRFSDDEIAYFLDIDFSTHVALVAVDERGRGAIVGGGRYILIGPEKAEVAFFVVDRCQGNGMGAALMRHLAAIGGKAGLRELSADVLADNAAMLKVFRNSGLQVQTAREADVVHVALLLP